MDNQSIAIITAVVMISLAVFAVIYFVVKHYLKVRANREIGKKGEKRVSQVLASIARSKHYKVINNLYLPLYDSTTEIDHIVIGPFGAVVIESKAYNGEIYGTQKEKEWTQMIGDKKNKFYNPLLQNKTHIDCIHHILIKNNVYRVDLESLVVFSGDKCEVNVPHNLPVISLSELKKYFNKSKFKQDKKIDVQKVYDTLMANQVTDKKLLSQHNHDVKKMAKNHQ
ncbi:MAG: nuclease-related domain-containing protein [Massiliimalia sp.]|jgi:hypothetical protein